MATCAQIRRIGVPSHGQPASRCLFWIVSQACQEVFIRAFETTSSVAIDGAVLTIRQPVQTQQRVAAEVACDGLTLIDELLLIESGRGERAPYLHSYHNEHASIARSILFIARLI